MSIKTLFVDAHTFDENHQGIRTFIKGIYQAIQIDSSKLQIYLAANNISNLKEEFKDQPDFKYIQLQTKNKYKRLAYEIPKIIKRHQFDFAHFNYYLPLFLNNKCQYIVTIHDVLFIDFPQYFPLKYRLINTYLFKRSALKAQILTTVSNYSAERIKYHFNIPLKQIHVLPNAINKEYTSVHHKQKDKIYIKKNYNLDKFIVYVSRIEPRKNHLKLLQAYKELELWKKEISLVFIGKESFIDPKLNSLIAEVNKESQGKLVRFDNVANKDLIRFYNAAELAVFPSLCEGFGIPPIESAVLKTPTLCSNSTAMKDFAFFGDKLFDANSKEILKKMLLIEIENNKLEQENERLEKIAESIIHTYSWNRTANMLKNLILKN
ncbi:MAG TPA: glycosyltransferase family 1 protein [Xanthomarina gelatinilytica]|uniref:Glycosyltransferase family 1 protein n=1 Tax=Xanthomarina gelatinilytica TaxID=1137281 RepID=A0A3D6BLZ3_9FLAO|nr:glycosyltransferase family 1 protein [Xanthomarina gelatinilytica]